MTYIGVDIRGGRGVPVFAVRGLSLCLAGVVTLLPTGNLSMNCGAGKTSRCSRSAWSLVRGGDRCDGAGTLAVQSSQLLVGVKLFVGDMFSETREFLLRVVFGV